MTIKELYAWACEKKVENLPVFRSVGHWNGNRVMFFGRYNVRPQLTKEVGKQYIRYSDLTKEPTEAKGVLV